MKTKTYKDDEPSPFHIKTTLQKLYDGKYKIKENGLYLGPTRIPDADIELWKDDKRLNIVCSNAIINFKLNLIDAASFVYNQINTASLNPESSFSKLVAPFLSLDPKVLEKIEKKFANIKADIETPLAPPATPPQAQLYAREAISTDSLSESPPPSSISPPLSKEDQEEIDKMLEQKPDRSALKKPGSVKADVPKRLSFVDMVGGELVETHIIPGRNL